MTEERNILMAAQRLALRHVRDAAKLMQDDSRQRIESIVNRSGMPAPTWITAILTCICTYAPVTVNFHPDRVLPHGITVVEGLLQDGIYRSQFETQVTSGSRTAYPGGDRDNWEKLLFANAYQMPEVRLDERPKYGALNIMNYADGAAPRFGSCYLKLRPQLSDRCTFTFGDSHIGPAYIGTNDVFEPLLASIVEEINSDRKALGSNDVDIKTFTKRILDWPNAAKEPSTGVIGRALNDYIEAQVHGRLDLAEDVEALVADPSFAGTMTGDQLQRLCTQCAIELHWHSGFQLAADAVPDYFRGPAMPPLARRLEDWKFTGIPGLIDAAAIGRAAASLHANPKQWSDWGTESETFQHLKQLWHVLVKFGGPYNRQYKTIPEKDSGI
ncbi:DUF3626 domain-containing protein [Paenibacillus mendelii]|uniref:DUF3626 domain-containing protein n=1 Tax=Paenibacillus mendelii TaxID=206163 RepID=A0ABV6JIG5_9BACL|nr:DUF3626 domain-containing protein [Paenibacillus mendelii]MCQ6557504.1 DUF3626 domain-containing protein [Paenibacillus mendelii]